MDFKDDITLLDQLKAGSKAAFEGFYKSHLSLLWSEAYRILGDQQLAEDAIQDLFIEFWEKKHFNKIESNLTAYMFTAVRRKCFRLQKGRRAFEPLQPQDHGHHNRPDQALESHEFKSNIEQAMAEMPAQSAKAFELYILENKKRKEVAKQMGISDNTVKSYLSTALKIAREKLLIFRKNTPIQ